MRLVTVYAPGADPRPLLAAYRAHLERTGRGNASYWWRSPGLLLPAGRTRRRGRPSRWRCGCRPAAAHRPVITFLMLHGHLRPGYDYLLERKFSSLWRELDGNPAGRGPCPRSCEAAAQLGFSERVRTAIASQVPARLLIQTGRRLGELTVADLDELAAAVREREQRTGQGWRHYQSALSFTRRVLFHLGILADRRRDRAETGPVRGPARRHHSRDRRGHDGLPRTLNWRPASPRPSPAWPPG